MFIISANQDNPQKNNHYSNFNRKYGTDLKFLNFWQNISTCFTELPLRNN